MGRPPLGQDRGIGQRLPVLARRDECSAPLREKALFIVSQTDSPEAGTILLDAARGDPDDALRMAMWASIQRWMPDPAARLALLGPDALLLGEPEKAREHFLAALAAGEKMRFRPEVALTRLALAELILDLLEKPRSLIRFVTDRPGHDFRYAISTEKIRQELGWKPAVTFEEGLRRTVDWYWRDARDRRRQRRFASATRPCPRPTRHGYAPAC